MLRAAWLASWHAALASRHVPQSSAGTMSSLPPSSLATVILFLPVVFTGITVVASPPIFGDDWLTQTERWREQRERQLRSADGWLAVTGLHWLQDGRIRFGSAGDCEIRLSQDSSPPYAGTLTVDKGLVLFTAVAGAPLKLNDRPASKGILSLDSPAAEADSSDRLAIGSSTLQLLRRTGQLALRVRDSNSHLIDDFPGERWYPPNRAYEVPARFIPAEPGTLLEFRNVRGAALKDELAGTVEFELGGRAFRLQATSDRPGTLFIVFRDETSGQQTWPGGRFLSLELPTDNSPLFLDFNRAYNPPCAYNPHTLCPLPPRENALPISIPVGAQRPHQPPAGDERPAAKQERPR
ncbi:MAG: DUF1684 domain-containing protein [Planctomycetota bacterium]